MKIILNKDYNLSSVLSSQTLDFNEKYRWIGYSYTIMHDNNYLVFNTLTRQLVSLSNEEYNQINCGIFTDVFKKMIEDWFLVPLDFDEYKLYNQIFNIVALMENATAITNFVILPTTDCNARCFYCFENGIERYRMTNLIAYDVADFIIKKSLGRKVHIQWFGGEPLCNIEAIDAISRHLKHNNICFDSWMITNGSLFDKRVISKAINEWNIQKVQITLDGTESVYNKCKNYKDDLPSPFNTVINNISDLLNAQISVTIRLNLDKHNYDDLYCLIDYIDSTIKHKENLSVYVWSLYDTRKNVSDRNYEQRIELSKRVLELENYIARKGFPSGKKISKAFRIHSCLATRKDSIVILPDGKLCKCDHSLSEFVGSIFDNNIDMNAIKYWQELWSHNDYCKKCILKPQCIYSKHCPEISEYDCNIYKKERKLNILKRQIIREYNAFINAGDS